MQDMCTAPRPSCYYT